MKYARVLTAIIFSVVFVVQFLSVAAAEPVQVVVSIPPQTYFVKQISGDLVDVMSMLPEGRFPHTFEPTAKQMKLLSKADMYVRIKVEFENAWWGKMLAVNPDMFVVDSTVGIDVIEGHEHHHEQEDEHHEGEHHKHEGEHHEHEGETLEHSRRDPHIWLSPKLVKIQAEAICEGLIHVDPDHKDTYAANQEIFLNTLDNLDQEIQQALANIETRKFMIFHPSWTYFARDYHLEQIPIELEGKEPSAAEMMQLMKTAKQENIRVIFVQPQTSKRSVEIIARQVGAGVEILDPLAANWVENMRKVARTLAEHLK